MRINRTVGLVTAALVAGFALAHPIPAAAQGQAIVTVDYMKAAPGQDEAYLQVEQKMWKPIDEAKVKAGNALGRELGPSPLAERDSGRLQRRDRGHL